ncbi:MAG: 1-acyl-sn-glycerol-3-phosphate acyltransferase [bacterium]|nr:1-acyl-sn-glycerol-3-phosphate acyltransferase [bacterium]
MGIIRLIIRVFLFIFSALVVSTYALVIGIGKWGAVKRVSYASKFWCYCVSKILGVKTTVHGDLRDVRGMIISNHLSYIDVFLLGSFFPLRFAAKSEIAKWPFLGYILGRSKPIWVNRNSKQEALKTMKEFIRTVEHGISVISFPEGTTSDGKNSLITFKSTTFEASIKGKFHITPIIIKYKDNDKICWYGDDTLGKHGKELLKMKKIEADLYILPSVFPDENDDRKSFSKKVYDIMNRKYMELVN